MTSIYGPVISPSMVEREVQRILQAWSPAYLAEIGRQVRDDPHALQTVKRWMRMPTFPSASPDEQVPFAITTRNGTPDTPFRTGRTIDTWVVIEHGVLVMAGGADAEEDAGDLASDYGMAHALALVQKGAKDSPLIDEVLWRGYSNQTRPADDQTQAADVHTFWVHVPNTLTVYGGPDTPPPDPSQSIPGFGQVTEVDLTYTSEDLTS